MESKMNYRRCWVGRN